jgi:hypothetical protein
VRQPAAQTRTVRERGAVLAIVAVAMTFLLGAAALAIDLAALRYDIRADRLASDAAATAGASAIDPFSGSRADEACQLAWEYVLVNLRDEGAATGPNCATFGSSCDPAVARTATGSASPYSITITHPIPDDHELMGGQALNETFDGVPCQRIGVTIRRTRDYAFATVMGFDTGTTEVRSVARITPDVGEGDVVPLVVLDPHGCDVLTADGQGKITVTHFEDSPGVIVVDSDGSGPGCGSSSPYIMEVQAEGQSRWIRAIPVPGPDGASSAILSYALSGKPGTVPSRAYNPADLTTAIVDADPSDPLESYFQLYPKPIFRSQRVTRAPIDHRYNCKSSYPLYLGLTIAPCNDATGGTHIDDHVTSYAGPIGSLPNSSWRRWTEEPGHSCNLSPGTVIEVSGSNWLIDCHPGFIVNGATVRIHGGNVVVDGDIDLRSSGVLEINPSGSNDHFVYVRDGDLKKVAQASINFTRTFVLLQDGVINLVGGSGGLVWIAPTEGVFEDIALWSESASAHELGGQAGNELTGTFFTPYADPFVLKGISGQLQTDAQFLTRRLRVTGFTEVLMKPDPETSTLIPIRGVTLIR